MLNGSTVRSTTSRLLVSCRIESDTKPVLICSFNQSRMRCISIRNIQLKQKTYTSMNGSRVTLISYYLDYNNVTLFETYC